MKIIYSSMLPLLAAVCVWTSGCGSLESAVESSTTTATTATETTETTVAETTTTSATETTTTSATETTTASATEIVTEIATEIAATPTTEATDDAATIEVFACTAGTWYMDGDPDTASLVMDGEGGVAAYYATGNLEYTAVIWNAPMRHQEHTPFIRTAANMLQILPLMMRTHFTSTATGDL